MLESVFIRRFEYICLFPFVSFPVPVSWHELYYETREDTQLWAEIQTISFPSLRSMIPSTFVIENPLRHRCHISAEDARVICTDSISTVIHPRLRLETQPLCGTVYCFQSHTSNLQRRYIQQIVQLRKTMCHPNKLYFEFDLLKATFVLIR